MTDQHPNLPPLIPREVLLGNPKRLQPKLSPDCTRLAYLAPDERDCLQIWVRTLGEVDDRCVSAERRSITVYGWTLDSKTILYPQDSDGDENFHVFAIDLATSNIRDLTPWRGVRCHDTISRESRPNEILAMLNVRNRNLMDVWRIDLRTGAATLALENPGDVAWWFADENLVVRGAFAFTPEGGNEVRVRAAASEPWRTLARGSSDEEVLPYDFSKDGREVILRSSIGSDTLRVVACEVESGRERELARMDSFDAEGVMIHPTRRAVEAVRFEPARRTWKIVDSAVAADFDAIAKLDDGDFEIASRDYADEKWIVGFASGHQCARYFLWERATKRGTFLFSEFPDFESLQLAERMPIKYRARDGMELHGYLTMPRGLAARDLPLVLFVHGGPWARDYWRLDTVSQLLANRGYLVLQPNYRGSTGYGRHYLHAGDRQWGLAMHDDLIDAVRWAADQGMANPTRVAIFGASYGGYAALAGAAFSPDVFRCAVDLVGPSSLFTLIRTFAPYHNIRAIWNARVGDPDDPADTERLTNGSPLFSADRIKIPMLIAHGANDPRVLQAESERIVAAIEKNGGSVTYVLYPDEGHSFFRRPNGIDFMARVEQFLAQHLGGRYQPMDGERFAGSTARVRFVGPRQ